MICAYAEQTLKKLFAKYWISVVSKKEKTKQKKNRKKPIYLAKSEYHNRILPFA